MFCGLFQLCKGMVSIVLNCTVFVNLCMVLFLLFHFKIGFKKTNKYTVW